jgi:hypothetical protein
MTTNYPGGLDNFTNPSPTDTLNSATVPHAAQHANANDAIEAIEAKLGTGASTPSANTALLGTGAGTTAYGQVPKAALASDAYMEGTWTPDLQFGGLNTGITYSARYGYYTKVGRLVFATFDFTLSSKGTATGSASITGLPFAVGGNGAAVEIYYWAAIPVTDWSCRLDAGTPIIRIAYNSAGNLANVDDTKFSATSRLGGSLVYFTS